MLITTVVVVVEVVGRGAGLAHGGGMMGMTGIYLQEVCKRLARGLQEACKRLARGLQASKEDLQFWKEGFNQFPLNNLILEGFYI